MPRDAMTTTATTTTLTTITAHALTKGERAKAAERAVSPGGT
jgi:hypothetical protein